MLYDLIIVGAGPAGLSAAIEASKRGLDNILLIERSDFLGGVLNQCIHSGFGLEMFKKELTGPEFVYELVSQLKETNVQVLSDTMVMKLEEDHKVHVLNRDGYQILESKAIIVACGCRERSRGAIGTPGDRCAGIYPAGAAQQYINIDGYNVGKKVVILGSGDIGLIMARRLTLEGAKVLAVVEINPFSSGLQRNIQQCLNDFDIPLYLSHTITNIKGKNRVEQVTMMEVDKNFKPIPNTETYFDCDTLLLSVGLIPENELTKAMGMRMDLRTRGPIVYQDMETSKEGYFACGNMVHVHDLVDYVALEAKRAADGACDYIEGKKYKNKINIKVEKPLTYSVPQKVKVELIDKFVTVSFRVNKTIEDNHSFIFTNERGVEVGRIKSPYLHNGEMCRIIIVKSIFAKCESELTISLSKED